MANCWPTHATLLRVGLLALLLTYGQTGRAQPTDEEYRVKAAFLFHFAQLIDWPASAQMESADAPLWVCTLGADPFQGALEATLAGKAIEHRSIRIRHLSDAQEVQRCHILFLGKNQSKKAAALVTGLHNAPVLTVGESEDFLNEGGMISFVLEENRVRFDINLAAAQSAQLKIGSRLLVLAQHVKSDGHGR